MEQELLLKITTGYSAPKLVTNAIAAAEKYERYLPKGKRSRLDMLLKLGCGELELPQRLYIDVFLHWSEKENSLQRYFDYIFIHQMAFPLWSIHGGGESQCLSNLVAFSTIFSSCSDQEDQKKVDKATIKTNFQTKEMLINGD